MTRTRTCGAYHYYDEVLCKETDVVYSKCRICWEYKPRTDFRKDSKAPSEYSPVCKICARAYEKRIKDQRKEQEKQPTPIDAVAMHLFNKEDVEVKKDDTLETKVDRILYFLWLTNKWKFKK